VSAVGIYYFAYIMPQFDPSLFPVAVCFCLAFLLAVIFCTILGKQLERWSRAARKLALITGAINNLENFLKSRNIISSAAGFFTPDLLEQFVLGPSWPLFVAFAIAATAVYAVVTFPVPVFDLLYSFVESVVSDVYGSARVVGFKFLPFFYAIFLTVLISNLVGLLPFAFTFTGTVAAVVFLSLTVFLFWLFSMLENF
jgi:hypothetical protein